MADSCSFLRTNLAAQTPVYDERFLEDWKPLDSPVIGRHETEVWKLGTGDTHISDRIEIGQPDLQNAWQRINAAECGDACNPPRVNVAFGTTRDSYYMEQMRLQSQLFCLTQLRYNTKPSEQIAKIMKGLKKIPEMYTTDFLQVNAFQRNTTVQIAGDDYATFTPDITGPVTNITGQLTTIDLGGTGNLPQSQLTWPYLNYLTTNLALEGYSEAGSGLPDAMFNLITDPRAWFLLTNGNDSMKDMMALSDPQQASALYKIGVGVQKPFGNIAPTLNKLPIRFQHMGNGLLNRVQEYYNIPTTTGIKRVVNPAWVNARYQLSFLWHPKAIKLFTPDFKKINEMVPSVNSALYGKWSFINPQGLLQYTMPDGTLCTKNNDEQLWFYWLSALELGFQYMYPEMIMPILHLVDGSGKDSTVNDPVCGDAPQYVAQDYSDDPIVCDD
jgi:hypothetical protein